MLFDQLHTGFLVFLMVVSCAVKHTAIVRLGYTQWFQQRMQGPQWWRVVLTMAICGGAMIYLIASKFSGWTKAFHLALVDTGLNAVVGWFAYRIGLFSMDEPKRTRVIIWVRIVFVLAYVLYIWYCLG